MATFKELRTRASLKLDQPLVSADVPETNVFWTRGEFKDWINEGYLICWQEISKLENLSLLTETDGTYPASSRSHSLHTLLGNSDDPLVIEEVRDVTNASATSAGNLIPYMHHRQFYAWRQGLGQGGSAKAGAGRAWCWFGYSPMKIEVWPVPTSALTLRVRYVPATPTVLSADGNIPVAIPTTMHHLLEEYAILKAREKEESSSLPDAWRAWFAKLERFMEAVEERQAQGSRQTIKSDPNEYMGSGR